MQKILLLSFVLFILLSNLQNVIADCDNSNLKIVSEFTAIDKDLKSISKYQYPYYKEDDILRLNKVVIENNGKCVSKISSLTYNITTPDNNTFEAFCLYVTIPQLEPNETYFMLYKNETYFITEGMRYTYHTYVDSQGKVILLCEQQLNMVGKWEIFSLLNISYSDYYSKIIHNNILDNGIFKVRSELDILSLEQQNASKLLSIIAILIAIILGILGAIIEFYLTRKEHLIRINEERAKQKQILRSIEVLMNEISMAIPAHEQELKKNTIPSYFIPHIDAFYYVSNLDSHIKIERRIDNVQSTYVLKQCMIKLENKINNINRLIELAQDNYIKGIPNNFFFELKNNTYYADAKKLLVLLRKEWIKLEGYTQLKQ